MLVVFLFLIVAFVIFLVKSVKRIFFPEVWIVDRLGTLVQKNPGWQIIIPGLEKVYKKIKANIQYSIDLFPEKEEIRIDLKDGGQVILKDPKVWIRVREPIRAVKVALNFEDQIREIVEHRITGWINNLTLKEVMEMKIPRVENQPKLKGKIDEVIQKSPAFSTFLKETGIEYIGFTLDDFDFPDITKKRAEIVEAEMEIKISENLSQARAEKSAGAVMRALSKLLGKPPEEIAVECAKNPGKFISKYRKIFRLILTQIAIEEGQYFYLDYPRDGNFLLPLIAALKRIPSSGNTPPKEGRKTITSNETPGKKEITKQLNEDLIKKIKRKKEDLGF